MKYKVFGSVSISLEMEVEADSQEEAIEKAYEEFDGLSNYAGNGALGGRLIGHNNDKLSIEACDSEPEFTEAQPA